MSGQEIECLSVEDLLTIVAGVMDHTVEDADEIMLSAASGQLDVPEIATWLEAHLRPAS